jgi:hypothetical protein
VRATWPILACLLFSAAATAANAKARTVKNLDGVESGTRVRIEGVVSMRGSTPLTILVIETADDVVVTIRSHSPDIERELKSLDGLRVAVEGEVLPLVDQALPRLDVDRYEMLAPPGAGDPITGVVAIENGACVLTTDEGKRYWMTGDLAPALCEHVGARVWMVGKKGKHGAGTKPSGSTAFTPTGYGVIDSSPAP